MNGAPAGLLWAATITFSPISRQPRRGSAVRLPKRRAKVGITAASRAMSTGHQVQVIQERVSSCSYGRILRASRAARQMSDYLVTRPLNAVV